jgi:hypothetical protein
LWHTNHICGCGKRTPLMMIVGNEKRPQGAHTSETVEGKAASSQRPGN